MFNKNASVSLTTCFKIIKILILTGSAELENLKLKKTILDDLGVPSLELKYGSIGKVALRIPSFYHFKYIFRSNC